MTEIGNGTGSDGLWAGACDVDITPAVGTELVGLFSERRADRIERRLYAKALALRCDGVTLLLISCDLLMMRAADLVDHAKARIGERTSVPPDHIMISATHTHSGPPTIPGHHPITPAELETIIGGIVDAAVGAVTTLVPARLAYGQTPVDGVCFNRRYRRTDGIVHTNPGQRDDLAGPAGPIDPTVTGLWVEHRDGRPLAMWGNLSLHYVSAETDLSISSDYFGAFTAATRRLVGGQPHVQLTNGCSGDINNVDLARAVPARGAARADLVAASVAGAAAAGTVMAARHESVALSATLTEVELDRVAVTDDDRAIAEAVLAGERADAPFSYVTGMPIPESLTKPYARRLLTQLAAVPEQATAPVQVLTVGDLCLVGLPGEIFVELGLAIRDGSRHPMTAMVGLANDHIGYVPTAQAWTEGGYETWRTGVSWTAPGSGERLVDAALAVMGR